MAVGAARPSATATSRPANAGRHIATRTARWRKQAALPQSAFPEPMARASWLRARDTRAFIVPVGTPQMPAASS